MGKPYSMDLRERVVSAIEGGVSTRQAAERFVIGIATAGTWARLKRQRGKFALPNRVNRRDPCLMGTRISFSARLQRHPTRHLTRWSSGCGRNAA
jgi:transposase